MDFVWAKLREQDAGGFLDLLPISFVVLAILTANRNYSLSSHLNFFGDLVFKYKLFVITSV